MVGFAGVWTDGTGSIGELSGVVKTCDSNLRPMASPNSVAVIESCPEEDLPCTTVVCGEIQTRHIDVVAATIIVRENNKFPFNDQPLSPFWFTGALADRNQNRRSAAEADIKGWSLSSIYEMEVNAELFSGSGFSPLPCGRVVHSRLNAEVPVNKPGSLIQPQRVTSVVNLLPGDFYLLESNLNQPAGLAGCFDSSVGTTTSLRNAFINGFKGDKGDDDTHNNRTGGNHFDHQPHPFTAGVMWIVGDSLIFYGLYRLRLRCDLRGLTIYVIGIAVTFIGTHLLLTPTLKL